MGVEEHRRAAPTGLSVSIITVSDTRTLETDKSGQAIEQLLAASGHRVLARLVVPDEGASIDTALRAALADTADAVILNGGTGIAQRDGTVEIVSELLDRELPGFGELFRFLSFEEIGAAAMLSRAVGGVSGDKAVFSLPGSTKAVTLAMEKLILPEVGHVVRELRK